MSGRTVSCPPGVIRPAMDRMRESMFAVLGDLEGLSFLDLFAGSGVVALEAISRGAVRALLVEKDARKRRTILENLAIVESDPQVRGSAEMRLLIRPVERVLKPGMERFDVVHLDPPFPMPGKENLLVQADRAGQPAPGGTLMIHYPAEDRIPEETEHLRLYDRRSYGRSQLAFYTRDD